MGCDRSLEKLEGVEGHFHVLLDMVLKRKVDLSCSISYVDFILSPMKNTTIITIYTLVILLKTKPQKLILWCRTEPGLVYTTH